MTQLTHTLLTNIELCYDGVHTPLTRTAIADLSKDENGFWENIVRDSKLNILIYENSNDVWCKSNRDSEGNQLSYEDSKGYWYKYTRDSEDNLLTCENKNGIITFLASDVLYGLYYQDSLYKAGCRVFTYEEAIAHWTQRVKENNEVVKTRAIKFLAAIEKHHQGLNNDTTDSHTSHQH